MSRICYHDKGFELLQEDLSSLLVKKESRQLPSGNTVYPTKRLKQVIPGRNVLIFVYIVFIFGFITYRLIVASRDLSPPYCKLYQKLYPRV